MLKYLTGERYTPIDMFAMTCLVFLIADQKFLAGAVTWVVILLIGLVLDHIAYLRRCREQ